MSYNCHNCQSAVKPEIETGPLKHTCILLFNHERSSVSHHSWMVICNTWFRLNCISVRVFEHMLPQHNTVILVVVHLGHIGNRGFCIKVGCHLRHWCYSKGLWAVPTFFHSLCAFPALWESPQVYLKVPMCTFSKTFQGSCTSAFQNIWKLWKSSFFHNLIKRKINWHVFNIHYV